jgi:hypothetical protein
VIFVFGSGNNGGAVADVVAADKPYAGPVSRWLFAVQVVRTGPGQAS